MNSPREVVMGATYEHPEHPGVVYFGCGRYFRGTNKPTNKFLIILKDAGNKLCGAKVFYKKDEPYCHVFWSKLIRIS